MYTFIKSVHVLPTNQIAVVRYGIYSANLKGVNGEEGGENYMYVFIISPSHLPPFPPPPYTCLGLHC